MSYQNGWFDAPYDVDPKYVHVSELEELEENIECAKEFLIEALKGLYEDKPLDYMERALEEAFSYLGIPFPDKELKVVKKQKAPEFYQNPYFQLGAILSQNTAQVLKQKTT